MATKKVSLGALGALDGRHTAWQGRGQPARRRQQQPRTQRILRRLNHSGLAGSAATRAWSRDIFQGCSVVANELVNFTGKRAFSVSEHSALRAGIFKALGSTDPTGFLKSAE